MFICICHALTESDVEWAADRGASHEGEVFGAHGVQPRCGKCVPNVKCRLEGRPCALRLRREPELVQIEINAAAAVSGDIDDSERAAS